MQVNRSVRLSRLINITVSPAPRETVQKLPVVVPASGGDHNI